MTRIRYRKNDNYLFSTKPVLVNNYFVSITIDLEKLSYTLSVSGENQTLPFESRTSKTLAGLKVKVKRTLRQMGANFNDEIRNRGSTEKL
jgi:hypothetical protein